MNFFELQDRAQRRTRFLLLLFCLAVIAIILVVNLIVLIAFGHAQPPGEPIISQEFISQHFDLLALTTLLTGGIIGFSSLYRSLNLRRGGGAVAREFGGSLVEANTTDPLRRRLRNVVEEIAIAAGMPVPEIYVLEQEPGINAFAAGYTPADAAVAVTRGALENLSRNELQGVMAHEFGHILNGDMRLNIRLIGILFGILVMALIGRRVLFAMRFSRNNRNSGGIMLLGVALLIVGYIGMFFGRWIKASVSRQREYLADASAVQFTRQPEGIAGALKKIGAMSAGSVLNTDTEEVGHMLFASGFARQMFSTHPPLIKRIRAIDPNFKPAEFQTIRKRMQRHAETKIAAMEEAAVSQAVTDRTGNPLLDAETLIGQIGQPGPSQILAAMALTAAIPRTLEQAAHSGEWPLELVCYLLIGSDSELRTKQLKIVLETLGADSESQVRALLEAAPELAPELRIPLLEISFPALRHRPEADLAALVALVERLIHADHKVDVFEYALARLLTRQINDTQNPALARTVGRRKLADMITESSNLLVILAHHGHEDPAMASAALSSGMKLLHVDESATNHNIGEDWPNLLDTALDRLDELEMHGKQQLLRAMVVTITHDGEVISAEMELLRAVCASLHIPLPMMGKVEQ
jgi:Zn-dependent protease with chaperone function